jgi:hypothetical protein
MRRPRLPRPTDLICGTTKQRSEFLQLSRRLKCRALSVARKGRDSDKG